MTRKTNNTALNLLVENQNRSLLINKLEKEITFDEDTTGAIDIHKILDITGVVAMQLFAVGVTDVTNGGTAYIEVGTATNTDALIAKSTGTDIKANEIWHDATPDSTVELISILTQKIVTEDVNYKVTESVLTGGSIKFYIFWSPISDNGNVTLA